MNHCLLNDENRELVTMALIFGILCFEAWLGKTNKVRAGSILELLLGRLVNPAAKVEPIIPAFPPEEKKEENKNGS